MTCSLQDVGHYRPLSELTLLSWAVFILHGCFLCCSSQCSCWGESSLLSSFPFNIIHSEVSVQHQSHRQCSWFLHYLIRLKDRGWAIGDFTLGKEIDLWNNQSVGSGRIFFKKKNAKRVLSHLGWSKSRSLCKILLLSLWLWRSNNGAEMDPLLNSEQYLGERGREPRSQWAQSLQCLVERPCLGRTF